MIQLLTEVTYQLSLYCTPQVNAALSINETVLGNIIEYSQNNVSLRKIPNNHTTKIFKLRQSTPQTDTKLKYKNREPHFHQISINLFSNFN